jgi:hypothetical protein
VSADGFFDDGGSLRFEIGRLDSASQTRRPVSTGQLTTADFTGLPVGPSVLYACARDDAGSELCRYQAVTVTEPAAGFDAGAALQDSLALELSEDASAAELAGSSQMFAALVSMATPGGEGASGAVASAISAQVGCSRRGCRGGARRRVPWRLAGAARCGAAGAS